MDMRKLLRAVSPWVPPSTIVTHQQQRRQQLHARWLDQIIQTLASTSKKATPTPKPAVSRQSTGSAAFLCFECRVRATGSTAASGVLRSTQQQQQLRSVDPFTNNFYVRPQSVSSSRFYSTHPERKANYGATTYSTTKQPTGFKPIRPDHRSPTQTKFFIRSAAQRGYRRRRSDALRYARRRRDMMLQAYSAPNAIPPLPRLRHRRLASHRKERRRKGDPIPYSSTTPTYGSSTAPTSTTMGVYYRRDPLLARQPYYHLKYRIGHRFPKRVRLLGFQHFLSRQTVHSKLYKLNVHKRIMDVQQRQRFQAKRRRFSTRRRFVRNRLSWLAKLDVALAHRDPRAITLARGLMMNKKHGVRQPSGAQFHKLVKLDMDLYFHWTRSGMKLQPPQARDIGAMLTTIDYNHMLRECLRTNDTKNALHITGHLIKRYGSPTFQLLDDNHAPPNAGLIYNMMKSLMADDQYHEALQLFQLVHHLYASSPSTAAKRLPLGLYDSFLSELGSQGHFDEVYAVLQFLEKHGPQPSMHTYNIVLEAVAFKGTDADWQAAMDFLDRRGENIVFDQETYLLLAHRCVRQHRITEAVNWLNAMEKAGRGYKLKATMFDPLIRECISHAVKDLPKMAVARSVNADRAVAVERQQPWINASLELLRVLTSRGLVPTVRSLDLLIEGFLRHGRLSEAQQILQTMTTTFAHPPTENILKHFFEYHLSNREYSSAIATLERMKSLAPVHSHGNTNQLLPRRKQFRDLMRALLADRQWTLAERTIYDMTFTAGVVLSTKELAQVANKMMDSPDSIERLLAIVGPVAPSPSADREGAQSGTSSSSPNFLQEARLTLMKAKSEAAAQLERDEVWPMWLSTLKTVSNKRDFAIAAATMSKKKDSSNPIVGSDTSDDQLKTYPLRALTSTDDEDRLVRAFAFFARACRQSPLPGLPTDSLRRRQKTEKKQSNLASSSPSSSPTEVPSQPNAGAVPSDWSFYPPRASTHTTLGSTPTSSTTTTAATSASYSKGFDSGSLSTSSDSVNSPSIFSPSTSGDCLITMPISKQEQDAYLESFIRSTRATLWNQLPSVQSRIRMAASEILQKRRKRIEDTVAQVEKARANALRKEKNRLKQQQQQSSSSLEQTQPTEQQTKKSSVHEDPLARARLMRLQAAYSRIQSLQVDLPRWAAQAYLQSLESHGQVDEAAAALYAKYNLQSSSSPLSSSKKV
ncbi:hypothetical protein BGW42_008164 [Actinomortierella wolfii]|nr:hypothetical protein BGW42_008164 [Actinomortierella wolfii]